MAHAHDGRRAAPHVPSSAPPIRPDTPARTSVSERSAAPTHSDLGSIELPQYHPLALSALAQPRPHRLPKSPVVPSESSPQSRGESGISNANPTGGHTELGQPAREERHTTPPREPDAQALAPRPRYPRRRPFQRESLDSTLCPNLDHTPSASLCQTPEIEHSVGERCGRGWRLAFAIRNA